MAIKIYEYRTSWGGVPLINNGPVDNLSDSSISERFSGTITTTVSKANEELASRVVQRFQSRTPGEVEAGPIKL